MTENTDATTADDLAAIDRDMSAWAESDAAVTALENTTTPSDTPEGREALDMFRRAGRPRLDGESSKKGHSPRRQVRLPDDLNSALDTYATRHNLSPSEVIRAALDQYLNTPTAA
ncbi:CopG family transcriptional regulator [Corynebacterium neomassiliense]|uniref:ribbon-helix-helix domain-containing protein n=1 Tax=Corynebacterium neomassiliense TaxID=2079482 RepID=UPI001031BE0F|nr:CopG family transcriptional regulator [Corynebacterium neomassiliense]